ncbi:MAG TPA: bidirectional hydrogenase complex protein HoxE [Candidatus Krumholzibacteria bacterium]|nr:bidirectional hydrogenase complex protein HoxE [Candidatus Krumholzibacteria bacterium]
MQYDLHKPEPPTDDKRWKLVSATMRRCGGDARALIETLHTVQDTFGYLDPDALKFVAVSLRVPYSTVFGVATFYHHFSMKPPGDHTCVVCTGTACHIKGAGELLEKIEQEFGVAAGETREDGKISVLEARCIGACGLAPVATFDGDVAGKLSGDETLARIHGMVDDEL